ncbi:MAG: hypothetical protein WD081_00265 [Gammaproteobacteria bacterium]
MTTHRGGSICSMTGFIHLIVPDDAFRLVHCLDVGSVGSVMRVPFDGRNWERAISEI